MVSETSWNDGILPITSGIKASAKEYGSVMFWITGPALEKETVICLQSVLFQDDILL
ncbi:hypothetical protein J3A65_000924 [Rhizobium sp. PvP014]|nr:hypothetical protein [Rhizobium sp. PvP014]MBP2531533.1 hypothetical protein [Rhizobium sp. PvP099]